MGRFDLFYQGLQGIFAALLLMAVCLSQAIFGWIDDAFWIRVVYGVAGVLLGIPMLCGACMYLFVGLTGDIDTRQPPNIFRRKP